MKNVENNITERQKETLYFIRDFIITHGYSPSVKEIANGLFVSKPIAHRHITALLDKGYITHIERTPRSIVIRKLV